MKRVVHRRLRSKGRPRSGAGDDRVAGPSNWLLVGNAIYGSLCNSRRTLSRRQIKLVPSKEQIFHSHIGAFRTVATWTIFHADGRGTVESRVEVGMALTVTMTQLFQGRQLISTMDMTFSAGCCSSVRRQFGPRLVLYMLSVGQ